MAALLWKETRAVGMSLGDRACISLAMKTSLPAFTTEGDWLKYNLGGVRSCSCADYAAFFAFDFVLTA